MSPRRRSRYPPSVSALPAFGVVRTVGGAALLVALLGGGCSQSGAADLGVDAAAVAARDLATAIDRAAPDLAARPGPDLGAVDDLATPDLAQPRDLAAPDLAPPPDPANPWGIRLTDVTVRALGGLIRGGRTQVNGWGVGSGAAIGDLDGDGRPDLILARNDDPTSDKPGGPTLFLRNVDSLGGFGPRFSVDPDFSALTARRLVHGVALGDYDRDGDLDVFLAAEGLDLLLRNDGRGHFTDVTAEAGVGGLFADISVSAAFADVNHDGLLDLYVVNYNVVLGIPSAMGAKRLYLNLGDGTFADVSIAAGADNPAGSSWIAAIFDFDGNGDNAIYVGNDRFSTNGMLSQNNPAPAPDAWLRLASIDDQGIPRFTDVTAERGAVANRSSMGISVADVDGDLTPDLYISDIGRKTLYLNRTPGGPVTEAAAMFNVAAGDDGFGDPMVTWGTHFCDLDRDGLLELFLVNGKIAQQQDVCFMYRMVPWYLREPSPGAPFASITNSALTGWWIPACLTEFEKGDPDRDDNRAPVMGDLDGDGDDDFVITGQEQPFFVYRNDTPQVHHALRLRLLGTVSSPDPVGATVIVTRLDGRKAAGFRVVGGETQSQSDGVIALGLGDDAAVARVDVQWPSGLAQRVDQLPGFALDQTVTVVEPAWLTVEPRVVQPGDPPAQLVYRPVDGAGAPLGKAGAGRAVTCTRSDGVAVAVTDRGDGSYTAPLPHPGVTRRTVVTLSVGGVGQRPRPMIGFR